MLTLTNFQVDDCDLSDDTLHRYLATPAIAVDTETMGLIPQRDRLSLVIWELELLELFYSY